MSLTFNNIRKDWIILAKGRVKAPFAPISRGLIEVQGMDGAYLESTRIEPLIINQPIVFETKGDVSALELKDELASWLHTEKAVPLNFDDESDRIYYAVVQNTLADFEKISQFRRGTIEFLVLDGYGYGPEQTLDLPDISTIENKGTAEADPIFELTAKKKATFAMVSNGAEEDSEYNLIGFPADIDEEVVDQKTRLFSERGETLSTWSEEGTQFDNGLVTGGQLGTDGTGIHPLTYGSPGDHKGWYGPALMKEIDPIQDFEVEMRLRANTSRPDELYRIEFYLYDENFNVLGKMAIRDFSVTMDRYAGEGRVGEFLGAGRNYLISQENYLREGTHFHGLVRMRRIGQQFEFYVARLKTGVDEGRHHDILNVNFNDVNNEYQGRLKHVQINIARHTDGPSASVPRINAISVYKLNTVTVDQTPYILDVGDKVLFDHKNEDLLINGEPRNDLKNFGGSFFKLQKGFNNLIVTPSDTFDSEVTFRDKYL